ncbi:MAG: FKBP-type peptidyl-prolyl cis-trans isomerase [Planctomycetota bacterium]|jgi:FKBP-type peptidyl-prolyl cis-trans isomerase 2
MTTIKQGSLVELEIELLDGDGDVLETTADGGPLEVRVGDGELPPTVEAALAGLEVGGALDVTCPAGEAFGPHDPEAIVSVPREDFPEGMDLEKGAAVGVTVEDDEDGTAEIDAVIVEVNPDAVILDANHPLAGQPARFRARVVTIDGMS